RRARLAGGASGRVTATAFARAAERRYLSRRTTSYGRRFHSNSRPPIELGGDLPAAGDSEFTLELAVVPGGIHGSVSKRGEGLALAYQPHVQQSRGGALRRRLREARRAILL